jgi:poly [ADP-ribose] polymerase 2/3/4
LFDNKFKDKSGHRWADRLDPPKPKKYTFIEKNYEESDDEGDAGGASSSKSPVKAGKEKIPEVESALAQPVQRLMQLIFNQSYFENTMASMEYDADKLPLGKLSKRTIENGFQLLKNLAEVLSDPNIAGSKYGTTYIDVRSPFPLKGIAHRRTNTLIRQFKVLRTNTIVSFHIRLGATVRQSLAQMP